MPSLSWREMQNVLRPSLLKAQTLSKVMHLTKIVSFVLLRLQKKLEKEVLLE
jgi:hypothetical protein